MTELVSQPSYETEKGLYISAAALTELLLRCIRRGIGALSITSQTTAEENQ